MLHVASNEMIQLWTRWTWTWSPSSLEQEMDLVLDPVGGGLRLAYYPQSEALVEGQMGYGAHIDSGGVTWWHNGTLKDFASRYSDIKMFWICIF